MKKIAKGSWRTLDNFGIFCYNVIVFYRSRNGRNCSPRFNKNPRFLIKHFRPVVILQPVLFCLFIEGEESSQLLAC